MLPANFHFKNNIIYKENKIFIPLESTIVEVLDLQDSLVILLTYNPVIRNQNVLCYTYDQKLKWCISKPEEFHEDNYITGIYLKNTDLYIYNINGVEYHVNKETGAFLSSELIK